MVSGCTNPAALAGERALHAYLDRAQRRIERRTTPWVIPRSRIERLL